MILGAAFDPERLGKRVLAHYAGRFGMHEDVAHRFYPGAGCSADVYRFAASDAREVCTFAAVHAHAGMALCESDGHPHAEQYFSVVRRPDDVLFDLTALCATQACGAGERVDAWGVVPLAREIPGTLGMCALLAAPAVFEGEKFEYLTAEGIHLRFLWVVPIFAGEAQLLARAGADALQRVLFASNVDLADLRRMPAA